MAEFRVMKSLQCRTEMAEFGAIWVGALLRYTEASSICTSRVSKTISRINIPSSYCLRPLWEVWQTFLVDSWTHTDRRHLADWIRVLNQLRARWATICEKEEGLHFQDFERVCASKFRVFLQLFFFPLFFLFALLLGPQLPIARRARNGTS